MTALSHKLIFPLVLSVSWLLASPAVAQEDFLKSITRQEFVNAGKAVFEARCSGCHGMQGDGQGAAAGMLNPKPRNLTSGIFKFKSGPSGSMPSDKDLLKTLNQGVIGTSMPSFVLMSEPQKQAVIEYIKTLAPDMWKKPSVETGMAIPAMPQRAFTDKQEFLKYATNGRVWFQEMGCTECHGASGKGDGPSAATLKDAWGNPITPANLHKRYIKRGYTVQDVVDTVAYGIDGTPMPGYLDAVPDKNVVWELAAWVFYLRGRGAGLYADEPIEMVPADKIPQAEVDAVIGKYLNPPPVVKGE